jgi:CBS domain-containing protein
MLLRDVMTAKIEDIPADATLMQAAEKMKRLDIGALPVREKDRLVGMITDRDIAVRAVAEGHDPKKMPVREAMSREICFCYEDESMESAAKLMEERQIRRLPVFDRSERAIGMVSLGDLAVRNHDHRLSGEVLAHVSTPSSPHA